MLRWFVVLVFHVRPGKALRTIGLLLLIAFVGALCLSPAFVR